MRYREEYADTVFKLALLGMNQDDICNFFDVSRAVLTRWRKKYPEFDYAIKSGREAADAKVAYSLFQKATGYDFMETKVFMYKGHIIKTKVKKHIPPDYQSQVFWLTNKQPKLWNKNATHDGDDAPPMKVQFEVVDARK